jgi:hypothetical protein
MLAFRTVPPNSAAAPLAPLDDANLALVLTRLFQPGHFVVAAPLRFEWRHDVAQTIPWELHHGRLLDPSQTREQQTFRSWTMTQLADDTRAAEPTIALYWQPSQRAIHVVRGLLCHVQDAYDAGGSVILTRACQRWTRELVATIRLDDFADLPSLADELLGCIWLAVIGTSRLPLTSLEAPLPDFVLGRLTYVYRGADAASQPLRDWRELLASAPWDALSRREQAKTLEFALRGVVPDAVDELVRAFAARADGPYFTRLLKLIFNEVSLSPYTTFVDAALAFASSLVRHGIWAVADETDFLGWLLRQIGRHLTAYDLVVFHHRGANYPDALLLDAVLARYLAAIDETPALFAGDIPQARLRRRALRQACLLRRGYEGHPVPDAPTSPGENARVLPPSFTRVPEEQILNPGKRVRRLFAGEPLAGRLSESARRLLTLSLVDLGHDAELAELGTAVFIDRPFGMGKTATAPDQTPLIAHEAFSAAVAERRLDELRALAEELRLEASPWNSGLAERLRQRPPASGLALALVGDLGRPVASLTDARRVNGDFVVTRTLGLQAANPAPGTFFDVFNWQPVWQRFALEGYRRKLRWLVRLKLGADPGVLALLDDAGVPRVLFESDPAGGYQRRGGIEFPRAGLRVWHVRDDGGQIHDLRSEEVRVTVVR